MFRYELKKGELNKLNNLNQDLKTIFNEYTLNDHCIIGDSILYKGNHSAHSNFKMFFEYSGKITLDSKALFKAIKDSKKYIQYIDIDDTNTIFLSGDNISSIAVGKLSEYSAFENIANNKIQSLIMQSCNSSCHTKVKLSKDEIIHLIENGYLYISKDDYRLPKFTKEVIPGLKKSTEITLYFFNHEKDNTLFYLLIKATRETCISYHQYTCLYM